MIIMHPCTVCQELPISRRANAEHWEIYHWCPQQNLVVTLKGWRELVVAAWRRLQGAQEAQ